MKHTLRLPHIFGLTKYCNFVLLYINIPIYWHAINLEILTFYTITIHVEYKREKNKKITL